MDTSLGHLGRACPTPCDSGTGSEQSASCTLHSLDRQTGCVICCRAGDCNVTLQGSSLIRREMVGSGGKWAFIKEAALLGPCVYWKMSKVTPLEQSGKYRGEKGRLRVGGRTAAPANHASIRMPLVGLAGELTIYFRGPWHRLREAGC